MTFQLIRVRTFLGLITNFFSVPGFYSCENWDFASGINCFLPSEMSQMASVVTSQYSPLIRLVHLDTCSCSSIALLHQYFYHSLLFHRVPTQMSTPNRDQGSPILRRRENCITTSNPPDEGTGGSVQNESDKETVDDDIPFATNGSVIALDTPSLCQEL